MSGSAHTTVTLSRCRVSLDAGVRKTFELRPDGSSPETDSHRRAEARFRARIEAAAPGIDALFAELEDAGYRFLSPLAPTFGERAQSASHAPFVEECQVELSCHPRLTTDELQRLVEAIVTLLAGE